MQVQTGIPLDLLFFIQALVIMFVAAPDLVRSIWRLGGTRTPTGTVVEGANGMTAAAPRRAPRWAPQRDRRCAPRGSAASIFAALGLVRVQCRARCRSMSPATFSFWIDKQGGAAAVPLDERRRALDARRRRHRRRPASSSSSAAPTSVAPDAR